jgi:hypothetical protein
MTHAELVKHYPNTASRRPLWLHHVSPSPVTLARWARIERELRGLPARERGKPRTDKPALATVSVRVWRARKATEMARGESPAGKRSRPATKDSLNADRPLAGPPRVSERHEA